MTENERVNIVISNYLHYTRQLRIVFVLGTDDTYRVFKIDSPDHIFEWKGYSSCLEWALRQPMVCEFNKISWFENIMPVYPEDLNINIHLCDEGIE